MIPQAYAHVYRVFHDFTAQLQEVCVCARACVRARARVCVCLSVCL